jgi:hypothetical protein
MPTSPPPAILDFPSFERELTAAIALVEAHVAKSPRDERLVVVGEQLRDAARLTADGRCPSDVELSRLTFGAIAARDLDDHPELSELLARLSEYLHVWPRGAQAPSWR